VIERTCYAVWEVTLRCRLDCRHCGSRAGRARPDELSTDEALELLDELVAAGIREVTLAGGEPLLRPDWETLVRGAADRGLDCNLLTGGYRVTADEARRLRAAGASRVSVSVDGLEQAHVFWRGRHDAWREALRSLATFRDAGLPIACNTQLNRLSAPDLPELYEVLRDIGVTGWQLQLTMPFGNAAEQASRILQPCELLDLFPVLALLIERGAREGVRIVPADCVGYFGPLDEAIRRDGAIWQGCQAGLAGLGIEADGAVKGCLSLPTEAFVGGNVRERPLTEILETVPLRMNLGGGTPEGVAHLWGFCATCVFAALCRGGCSNTTQVLLGRRGNNPYCHHRAVALAREGRRERVRLARSAPDRPFGVGLFDLVEEPFDAPWPEDDTNRFTADRVRWPASTGGGRVDVPVVRYRGGEA
jgi:radical SAM protein with 4Fe4S-binding SPASM domain